MPQRILHVVGRMDRAGAETLLMNLYREIDKTRFQFDFVYFTDDRCDFDDEINALGGRIVRICKENLLSRALGLWKALRSGNWSVVHAHTLFSSGIFLLAAMMAKIPRRVAHAHSTSDENGISHVGRAYQYGMRWLLSKVPTDYIACGTAAADFLFPGRLDIHLVPNAIDISRFLGSSNPSRNNVSGPLENGITILQVGRLVSVKNHLLSLKIALALSKEGVNFQMLFVGAGPQRQAIEEFIHRHHLEARVLLLGLRDDISKLMSMSDVMLMPSLYEGFPVVLVESQAAGLPAVIANTISQEVDLDLGLVSFVNLDASPEHWASCVCDAAKVEPVTIEVRRERMESRGFSARTTAARLALIYEQ